MKKALASLCLAGTMAGAALAAERTPEEIRSVPDSVLAPAHCGSAVEALVDTEYCGTSMLDGMGLASAAKGETPLADGSLFRPADDEWVDLLADMAEEELAIGKRELSDAITEMRELQAAGFRCDGSNNDGTRRLWALQKFVWEKTERLRRMTVLLRHSPGKTERVLDVLERIALECPPESNMLRTAIPAWVGKACREGAVERCVGLGLRYREAFGPGSDEEWKFFREFAQHGMGMSGAEGARQVAIRYMLGYGDTLSSLASGLRFDDIVLERMDGWKGSLQRHQLIERCMAGEKGDGTGMPEGREDARTIKWSNVPAADERDLTDLREVYGAWDGLAGEGATGDASVPFSH